MLSRSVPVPTQTHAPGTPSRPSMDRFADSASRNPGTRMVRALHPDCAKRCSDVLRVHPPLHPRPSDYALCSPARRVARTGRAAGGWRAADIWTRRTGGFPGGSAATDRPGSAQGGVWLSQFGRQPGRAAVGRAGWFNSGNNAAAALLRASKGHGRPGRSGTARRRCFRRRGPRAPRRLRLPERRSGCGSTRRDQPSESLASAWARIFKPQVRPPQAPGQQLRGLRQNLGKSSA